VIFPSGSIEPPTATIPTDGLIPKDLFNPYFLNLTKRIKDILSKERLYLPRLPKEITSICQTLVQHCLRHVPKSPPKAKTPVPAQAQADTSPSKSKPTPAKGTKSDTKDKAPSTPKASASSGKASATPKKQTQEAVKKQPSASDIFRILQESKNPTFFFDKEHTPSFSELFPNTTTPRYVIKSGTPFVNPDHLKPLLQIRLNTAKTILRKHEIHTSRLPATFVKGQVRLITRSITVRITSAKQAQKEKKKAKAAKAKAAKSPASTAIPQPASPSFVPASEPSSFVSKASSAPTNPLTSFPTSLDQDMTTIRENRSRLQALCAVIRSYSLDEKGNYVIPRSGASTFSAKTDKFDICPNKAVSSRTPCNVDTCTLNGKAVITDSVSQCLGKIPRVSTLVTPLLPEMQPYIDAFMSRQPWSLPLAQITDPGSNAKILSFPKNKIDALLDFVSLLTSVAPPSL